MPVSLAAAAAAMADAALFLLPDPDKSLLFDTDEKLDGSSLALLAADDIVGGGFDPDSLSIRIALCSAAWRLLDMVDWLSTLLWLPLDFLERSWVELRPLWPREDLGAPLDLPDILDFPDAPAPSL